MRSMAGSRRTSQGERMVASRARSTCMLHDAPAVEQVVERLFEEEEAPVAHDCCRASRAMWSRSRMCPKHLLRTTWRQQANPGFVYRRGSVMRSEVDFFGDDVQEAPEERCCRTCPRTAGARCRRPLVQQKETETKGCRPSSLTLWQIARSANPQRRHSMRSVGGSAISSPAWSRIAPRGTSSPRHRSAAFMLVCGLEHNGVSTDTILEQLTCGVGC